LTIFGIGIPELIIIIVVILLIFGPGLFKKLGKRGKETFDAAKKGIEEGAKENGKDVDLDNMTKDDVLDGVDKMQNKVDEMFTKAEEDEAKEKAAKAAKEEGTAKSEKPEADADAKETAKAKEASASDADAEA
jgi:sec-independent protein translocase protein TatA